MFNLSFLFVTAGMPDNVLVLRTVMTVGNYDYMCDYIFRQNGAIEARLSLTGFISGARYEGSADAPYGYQLRDNMQGSLHSHFANFKLDMDILGTTNRFATLNLERTTVKDPFDSSNSFPMNKFVKVDKKTEKEGAYKFNFDTPKYLIFYNEKEKNRWGSERAYRLHSEHMAKSLIPEGEMWEKGASWIRYQVIKHITKSV